MHGNSLGTSTYPGSMRSPAASLDSPGHWWIEDVPTSYLDLIVTLSQPQWSCSRDRHAKTMPLPFNDFCLGCRSAKEEQIVIHFLCQCLSLARHRYWLFGFPFFVSFAKLSIYILVVTKEAHFNNHFKACLQSSNACLSETFKGSNILLRKLVCFSNRSILLLKESLF